MPPPPFDSWPPGAETIRPPPRSHRRAAPGNLEGDSEEPPPPSPPLPPPPQPTDSRSPARGPRPRTPPRPARGETPPQEGCNIEEGAPLRQYALLYAACPQSAARQLPQYQQQAVSLAPARKGNPRAAPGRRHADVSLCSVGGGAMTRRPAFVPAREGRGDGLRQRDPLVPRPTGPPGRAPDEGRHTNPPPPPPPDRPISGQPDRAQRPGLPNSPGRACGREECAAPRHRQ